MDLFNSLIRSEPFADGGLVRDDGEVGGGCP